MELKFEFVLELLMKSVRQGKGQGERQEQAFHNCVCLLRSLRSINLRTICIAKTQVRQLFFLALLSFYSAFFCFIVRCAKT